MYRNPQALPRAFIAEQTIVADGPRDAIRRLLSRDVDVRRVAILEESPVSKPAGRGAAVAPGAGIEEYHPGDVRITVSSPSGGTLVFPETYLSSRKTCFGVAMMGFQRPEM